MEGTDKISVLTEHGSLMICPPGMILYFHKDCFSAQTWSDQLLEMKWPKLPLRLEGAPGWKSAGFWHQTGAVSHHHHPWQLRQQGGGGGVLREMADC